MASNQLAAIRRSRRCTGLSVSLGEETAGPRLRLATVTAPTTLDPPAVAVAVAAAVHPGDCLEARTAYKLS